MEQRFDEFYICKGMYNGTQKSFQQGFQGTRNSKLSVLRDPPELELLDLARISNLGNGGGKGIAGLSSEFPDVSEESEDLRIIN